MTTRRTLLIAGTIGAVGGTVILAGCGTTETVSPSPTASQPEPDALRESVATAERELIRAYDAAILSAPLLADALTRLRTQHADHLSAMGIDGAEPSAPEPSAPDPSAPDPSATAATSAGADAVLTTLIAAEREAARARRRACLACPDADLARTLALIAASEQSHVPALRRLAAS